MNRGVHASLDRYCHIHIVYAKLDLKIEYPPTYERLVWNYNKTNTQLLNGTIEVFSWEKLLENKNVNEQLYLFNKIMLNIFHKFIPNKNIICNDKDPAWFNNQIKILIETKNHLLKTIWLMVH